VSDSIYAIARLLRQYYILVTLEMAILIIPDVIVRKLSVFIDICAPFNLQSQNADHYGPVFCGKLIHIPELTTANFRHITIIFYGPVVGMS